MSLTLFAVKRNNAPCFVLRANFESLRPYRWRLTKMRDACKPVFSFEYKRIAAALDALDRAASDHLTPEEYAEFTAPWIPIDHA
jgi:hypothetical protein